MKKIRKFLDYFYNQDRKLFEDAEKMQINDAYSLPYRVTGAIECWYWDHQGIDTAAIFKLISHVFRVGYLQGGRAANACAFEDPGKEKNPHIENIEDFLSGEALGIYENMVEWLTGQNDSFSIADETLEGLKTYLMVQTRPGRDHLTFDDASTNTIASSFYIGYMMGENAQGGKARKLQQRQEGSTASQEESPMEGMNAGENDFIAKYRMLSQKGRQDIEDFIEYMTRKQEKAKAAQGGSHE